MDHLRGRRSNPGERAGYRNFPFAGLLVQRDLGKKVTLGTEIFYHGPEGLATPQTRPATLVDIGGYHKFRDPGFQLLFCYGHTAIGQTENSAYLVSIGLGARKRRMVASLAIRIRSLKPHSPAWLILGLQDAYKACFGSSCPNQCKMPCGNYD